MKPRSLLNWSARLFGLLISGAYLTILVGEGVAGLYWKANPVLYLFFLMMAFSVIGYCVSWYSQKLGSWMMISGGACMLIFHAFRMDLFTGLIYGGPFILVGLLYVLGLPNERPPRMNNVKN